MSDENKGPATSGVSPRPQVSIGDQMLYVANIPGRESVHYILAESNEAAQALAVLRLNPFVPFVLPCVKCPPQGTMIIRQVPKAEISDTSSAKDIAEHKRRGEFNYIVSSL